MVQRDVLLLLARGGMNEKEAHISNFLGTSLEHSFPSEIVCSVENSVSSAHSLPVPHRLRNSQ